MVVEQIVYDLENGEIGNWGWAIGVLLLSGNEEIKKHLKKALLDDKKFTAKAVLALLNVTKIGLHDESYLFEIIEGEVDTAFSITVKFRGEKLFKNSINYGKFDAKDAVGITRNKILGRIVEHFCGK